MEVRDQFLSSFIKGIPKSRLLAQKASEAEVALEKLKFPTRKDESWKYTRVGSILKEKYSQTPSFSFDNIEQYVLKDISTVLVFVNGYYSTKLSKIDSLNGIKIEPLAEAKKRDEPLLEEHLAHYASHKEDIFTALNTVHSTNGIFANIEKNTSCNGPIQVIHLSDGQNPAFNPRNLIIAEEGSSVKILQSFHSINGGGFVNSVTEIVVRENAHVEVFTLQNQNNQSKQVNVTEVKQFNNSSFSSGVFTFGGALVRNNLNIRVEGSGCETNIYGLYLTKEDQHVDNHTRIDHLEPNCISNEKYKGILAGKSTGVFNGKVFVKDIAQQTNAYQSNQNILLSDDARVYSKPELEIYADDVKCSHGSTTGQFDEEALFYLRSRGISESNARKLLVEAFASDVIDIISVDSFKQKIVELVHSHLESA